MPRGKRNRNFRRNKGGRSAGNNITKVKFHNLHTVTTSGTTGVAQYNVGPQSTMCPGLNEISDQFDLFRVARLMYRVHPMDPTYTTNQGACFYPDVDIQVQTIAQLSESPIAAVQTPFTGVPSRWVNVPRAALKGMLDWYKCTPDAGSTEFEGQGTMQYAGGLAEIVRVEYMGVFHFKNPVSSTLQVERTIKRLVEKGLVIRLPTKHTTTPRPVIQGDL